MYRHLLVPIDGSPLSNSVVEQAVAMARESGAHITFLHARPDFGATSDGALLHAAAPQAFVEGAQGNSTTLLAKAEAGARGAGVACSLLAVIHDRPHEAILENALARGCDLIFMGSHGRRGLQGLLQASVLQKVLQRTPLPVLVAAIESNLPPSDAQRALGIIKDEHRSLAAVVRGLEQVLREARASGQRPDIPLVRAMLYYIEKFPEALHHPKEEAFLFRLLRARTHAMDGVLDGLVAEHAAGAVLFRELREALADFEAGAPGGDEVFHDRFARFAQAQWKHIGAEESLVLPAASEHLTPHDWQEVAAAFLDNADPRFGAQSDGPFVHLSTRLLNLAADALTDHPGDAP